MKYIHYYSSNLVNNSYYKGNRVKQGIFNNFRYTNKTSPSQCNFGENNFTLYFIQVVVTKSN